MTSLQPTPRPSSLDIANALLRDAKPSGYGILGMATVQRSDRSDIVTSKLGANVPFPTGACPMADLISLVFRMSFPNKMPLRHAPKVPFSATVCRLMARCRRRPIGFLAHATRGEAAIHPPVPVLVLCVRPRQTLVAFVGHDYITEIALVLATLNSAGKRIAMGPPAIPVFSTPPARTASSPMSIAIAAIYGTCFELCSHLRSFRDRYWSGLEQVLTHRFGPLFMPEKSEIYNCRGA